METQFGIKKIGPVKELDISLNNINVFMGPQSSGKSTIAKIISFCLWLEKDCIRRQRTGHVDDEYVRRHLIAYHNMADYFTADSKFYYRSEIVNIDFDKFRLKVTRGQSFHQGLLSKNAYIPSERNLIGVPGIFDTRMPDNYIMGFLREWLAIRRRYTPGNRTPLGSTGDEYYYDESAEVDMLMLPDSKSIPLSQVSSGLQSLTPLTVCLNYLTDWIYTHREMRSADEEESALRAALASIIDFKGDKPVEYGILDRLENQEDLKPAFDFILAKFMQMIKTPQKEENRGDVESLIKMADFVSRPSYSNIVIEEPEQNLFPETQRRLVEHILAVIDKDRDNLVMTTHSPFVLYSLNNCMLAWLVGENAGDLTEEEEQDMVPSESRIAPGLVSVWELRDGYLENYAGDRNRTIQDDRGLIRGNYFDRVMGNVMTDFQNMLGLL